MLYDDSDDEELFDEEANALLMHEDVLSTNVLTTFAEELSSPSRKQIRTPNRPLNFRAVYARFKRVYFGDDCVWVPWQVNLK